MANSSRLFWPLMQISGKSRVPNAADSWIGMRNFRCSGSMGRVKIWRAMREGDGALCILAAHDCHLRYRHCYDTLGRHYRVGTPRRRTVKSSKASSKVADPRGNPSDLYPDRS